MRLAALPLALLLTLPAQAATVLSFGDGDTIRVDDHGKRLTIRLACIDAPEMAQGTHGQQSRALFASLAPVGSEMNLKVVDTDRNGRSVAEKREPPFYWMGMPIGSSTIARSHSKEPVQQAIGEKFVVDSAVFCNSILKKAIDFQQWGRLYNSSLNQRGDKRSEGQDDCRSLD